MGNNNNKTLEATETYADQINTPLNVVPKIKKANGKIVEGWGRKERYIYYIAVRARWKKKILMILWFYFFFFFR